jgi:hypothetical protein
VIQRRRRRSGGAVSGVAMSASALT